VSNLPAMKFISLLTAKVC